MSIASPTFLSVFTGIGGFDLGLERSGWRCDGQIEVDPFCNRVLARHWPNVPRWGDVRGINASHIDTGARANGNDPGRSRPGCASGAVDLLCGGFPCQDLSIAGRRAGLSAARSGLFFEFVRLAGELRPRWILLENVPGLFSSNGGRDFALILHTLDQLGYGVSWRVLDSRYFGVPQRRRRVFIVGHLGAACPVEVLFEFEGSERDSAPSGEAGESVAYCFAASAGGFGRGRDGQDTFVIGQNGSDVQVSRELGALTSGQARQTSGDLIAFSCKDDGRDADCGVVPTLRSMHGGGSGAAAVALSNRGMETGSAAETLRSRSHGALPMVSESNTPKGDSGVSPTLVRRLTPL